MKHQGTLNNLLDLMVDPVAILALAICTVALVYCWVKGRLP